MTTPIILPQLIVEAGLATASPPVQPAGTFTLNDAVNGVLGTSMLGGGIAWTDISPWVSGFTITRPSTRLQGPLFNFQAGTASILLDNSDGRFDPDNLAGPYVTPGVPAGRFGGYLDQSAYGTAGWTATLAAFESITGVPLNAARWYANTSYSFTGSLVALAAAGTRICLELTPTVAGSPADRSAIAAMLDAMLAAGADVRVSLWHEPNINGLSAADFTSMIAYYGPTVRQRYPLWCVFSGSDCIEANGYFPGAANCDGVAADCYGLSTANLDNCADMADNHGLPLGLWEFNTAFDLGISPSPVVGATQAQDVAFLAYVQALFTARIAAGKPVGDILLFTGGSSPASGGGTGTGNFLGTSLSDAGGFESGIAHWAQAGNCTIARSTAQAHSGTGSLAMTATSASTMVAGCENLGTSTTYAMPVVPGQSVAATCWFRAATAARSCAAAIGWYTSGGVHIGSDTVGATVTDSTSAWTFAQVTGTAPATTAFCIIKPQVQSPAGAGEVHYVDDPQASALPASIDHTAPIQYPWDWRIAPLAAMQAALDNRGAIPAVTGLTAMVPVRVRASFLGTAYPLYSGFADGWLPGTVTYEGGYAEITVAATDGQKVLNGVTLPATGAVGAGEAAGARVSRVLDAAGWYTGTLYRSVSAGTSAVQAYAGGDTAWNLMQIATDSEIGQLYVSGSGQVVFRGRQGLLADARSNAPQAVFGDLPGTVQPAGTELPYAAVGRASDDTTIANDIQATRTGGGALQHVQDAASIAKYKFPRSYARSDLILSDDATTLSWAQWVLYVSKGGEDRFESLQVDPQADPVNLWPQVLGREVGDRIQVWQRPASVAPVTKDCFIAGITHTWDSVTSAWLTTWTLQDASKYGSFLTLNNPVLGRLNFNALAFLRAGLKLAHAGLQRGRLHDDLVPRLAGHAVGHRDAQRQAGPDDGHGRFGLVHVEVVRRERPAPVALPAVLPQQRHVLVRDASHPLNIPGEQWESPSTPSARSLTPMT